MNLKDSDCFKSWLTATLESTFTFKPTAELLSYVFGFLKNERSMNQLRVSLSSYISMLVDCSTYRFIHLLAELLKNELFRDFSNDKARIFWSKENVHTCENPIEKNSTKYYGLRPKTSTIAALVKPKYKNLKCFSKTCKQVETSPAVKKMIRDIEKRKVTKRKMETVNALDDTVRSNGHKRKYIEVDDKKWSEGNKKRRTVDYNDNGMNLSSNELQLKNIPCHLNTVGNLSNIFSKFGNITKIRTSHEGKEAKITFTTNTEAQNAYQTVRMVFGSLPITAIRPPDNIELIKPISVKDKNIQEFNDSTSKSDLTINVIILINRFNKLRISSQSGIVGPNCG